MKSFKSFMVLLIVIGMFVFPITSKTHTAKADDNAISVSNGVPVKGELSQDGSNKYEFTTNQDGEAYISLSGLTAGFTVSVYDAYGNKIDGNYEYSGGYVALDEGLKQGTYYVEVDPYNWNGVSSATYTLKATYAGDFTRNPSTYEPNDTFGTAMSIGNGKFIIPQQIHHSIRKCIRLLPIKTEKLTLAFLILQQDLQ
jgi:cell wall-associated protease